MLTFWLSETLNLNTPVVRLPTVLTDRYTADEDETEVIEDIGDAIAVATSNLGLIPGTAFQARVMMLAELNIAHKTVSIIHYQDSLLRPWPQKIAVFCSQYWWYLDPPIHLCW